MGLQGRAAHPQPTGLWLEFAQHSDMSWSWNQWRMASCSLFSTPPQRNYQVLPTWEGVQKHASILRDLQFWIFRVSFANPVCRYCLATSDTRTSFKNFRSQFLFHKSKYLLPTVSSDNKPSLSTNFGRHTAPHHYSASTKQTLLGISNVKGQR